MALFDTYAGSYGLIMIALGECFAVGWVFGVERYTYIMLHYAVNYRYVYTECVFFDVSKLILNKNIF